MHRWLGTLLLIYLILWLLSFSTIRFVSFLSSHVKSISPAIINKHFHLLNTMHLHHSQVISLQLSHTLAKQIFLSSLCLWDIWNSERSRNLPNVMGIMRDRTKIQVQMIQAAKLVLATRLHCMREARVVSQCHLRQDEPADAYNHTSITMVEKPKKCTLSAKKASDSPLYSRYSQGWRSKESGYFSHHSLSSW